MTLKVSNKNRNKAKVEKICVMAPNGKNIPWTDEAKAELESALNTHFVNVENSTTKNPFASVPYDVDYSKKKVVEELVDDVEFYSKEVIEEYHPEEIIDDSCPKQFYYGLVLFFILFFTFIVL